MVDSLIFAVLCVFLTVCCLLASMVSDEKLAITLKMCIWDKLLVSWLFGGLSLFFDSLIMMCVSVGLWVYTACILWTLWVFRLIFFIKLGGIFSHYLSILSAPCFALSFWDSHCVYVGILNGVSCVLGLFFAFLFFPRSGYFQLT